MARTLTTVASDDLTRTRIFFCVTLVAAAAVEIAGACSAATVPTGLQFLLLNLMLGGAAGMIGAVLGFIFGIPKTSDNRNTAGGDNPGPSRPNTNLGDISDWLTKILVGASLTSIASLPHFLAQLVAFFDKHSYKDMPGGGTLAVFVILYFSTLGFYWSYLETRTTFTALIDSFARTPPVTTLLKVRSAPWEPGSPPIPEDAGILALSPSELTTGALLEARAAAETRAGRLSEAANFYREAAALDPGNPRLQSRLSVVLAALGKTSDAEAVISHLQNATSDSPAQRSQLDVNKVVVALYKPPPGGFTEAINIGEPLLKGDQAGNGQLKFWLACAYAQRAQYNANGKPVPPDDPDRIKALACLKDMIRLRPDLLQAARAVWRPNAYGGTRDENDLEIFRDDADFVALLNG